MEDKKNSHPNMIQFAMHEAMHALYAKVGSKNDNADKPFEELIASVENFKSYPMREAEKPDLVIHPSLLKTVEGNICSIRKSFKVSEDIAINHIKPK